MYAVVTTGGKQHRVSEGDIIRVEKLDAEVFDCHKRLKALETAALSRVAEDDVGELDEEPRRVMSYFLDTATMNVLRGHGLTLGDAANMTDAELLGLDGIGECRVYTIRTVLKGNLHA